MILANKIFIYSPCLFRQMNVLTSLTFSW